MYLTVKQQLKHLSKQDYRALAELCHYAKNLSNQATYNVRQHFFETEEYLNYESNYKMLKSSENYKALNSNMAQQILKEIDGSFKSFFALIKLAKEGKYDFKKIKIPGYLPKDGYTTLVVGFVRLNGNKFVLPYSTSYKKNHKTIEIAMPPILENKKIKEIRIIPKSNARFFEIQYTYKAECVQRNLNKNNALAIDLGINNLVTAVTSSGRSFIIDGRRLKSINQWYNKKNSRLQGIKDKQNFGKGTTKHQSKLAMKRNNKVNDYMSKSSSIIIKYCIDNNIGTVVLGYNESFQTSADIGKKNNQNFVNIPYGKLKSKLEYLCDMNDINLIIQEESYSSKASFWDEDVIPTYKKEDEEYKFSGKRISRGMYKTADNKLVNADVNAALNILRKCKVVSLDALYNRGDVDTPVRIRIA